jgi:hypothetical protein
VPPIQQLGHYRQVAASAFVEMLVILSHR